MNTESENARAAGPDWMIGTTRLGTRFRGHAGGTSGLILFIHGYLDNIEVWREVVLAPKPGHRELACVRLCSTPRVQPGIKPPTACPSGRYRRKTSGVARAAAAIAPADRLRVGLRIASMACSLGGTPCRRHYRRAEGAVLERDRAPCTK